MSYSGGGRDSGTLVDEASALQLRLAQERRSGMPAASALTAAGLRLLPLLPTHLSFPEIAAEVFLSPNTVKSQAFSIGAGDPFSSFRSDASRRGPR